MEMSWTSVMEKDFETVLESDVYDAASDGLFNLARVAYRLGYQRGIEDAERKSPIEPAQNP